MGQEERRLLAALYEDYLVPLKKLAFWLGIEYDDIEDMVHETIMTYYVKYPLDWSDKQKKVMLAKILYHKWIDNYRKNKHYESVSIDNTEEEFLIMNRLLEKDVLTKVLDDEMYRIARKCIDELKPDWRTVIVLHILEGRDIAEVSALLGITETVCRSRISRARKSLKEKLKDSGFFNL